MRLTDILCASAITTQALASPVVRIMNTHSLPVSLNLSASETASLIPRILPGEGGTRMLRRKPSPMIDFILPSRIT